MLLSQPALLHPFQAQDCCKTNPTAFIYKRNQPWRPKDRLQALTHSGAGMPADRARLPARPRWGLTYGRPCRTLGGSASRHCCNRQIEGGLLGSIPGSSPPGPASSARAVGEEGNKARAGSELRAVGFAGTWLRLSRGKDSSDSLVGLGEHLKLFGFVLSDPPTLQMRTLRLRLGRGLS